ncbi:MAG: hypothetical protein GXO83_03460 [Chlorobi bacterium]|nr:hypothetical protein [Chlorobiota bacterium]
MNIKEGHILFLLAVLLWLSACQKSSIKQEQEGEIVYNITYVQNDLEKFTTDLLPKKLIVRFKDDNIDMEIDGFFGLFNISNIINARKKTNITYLSILDKKFYYQGDFNEPAVGFGTIAKLDVKYVNSTKELCGYEAKEAFVKLPDQDIPIPIYYTSAIKVENPNRATPYSDINGILLEFYLDVSKLKMKLLAEGVYFKDIDDGHFEPRKGYQRISRQQMEEILDKLME